MTAIVPIVAESIDGYDAPDRPWSQVQACLDTDDGRVRRAWLPPRARTAHPTPCR
jgi:hypothetical protein